MSAVFHATNLQDPSEILSIGLVDIEPEEFEKMLKSAKESEQKRADHIDEVADLIDQPAMYHIIYTIP